MRKMLSAALAAVVMLMTAASAQAQVIPRLMVGCEPLQVDAFTIEIQSCFAANATGDANIVIPADTMMTITNNGAWGVDRSFAGNVPGWWYLWGIGNALGTQSAMMLSPSPLGGGVILPAGYTRMRFMGAAFYINGSSSGMRRTVLTSWPNPIGFLYQDQGTAHEVVIPSTGGAWQIVDLSDMIPRDARVAYLGILATGSGNVWVRTPNSGDGGFAIPAGEQTTRHVAVSSIREIQVRTAVGASITLRVYGFETLSVY